MAVCGRGVLSIFIAVTLLSAKQGCCSLVLELREPSVPSAVILTTEGSLPRSISLVLGHTYHIMCRDTSNTRRFDDDPNLQVWRHDGTPVPTPAPDSLPAEGVAAVYASTVVSVEANEWTLVLQRFGSEARGSYTCHGLDEGQTLSLDIGQTSLSVIAGTPLHSLRAGPLPSNGVISLSPFISPSSLPTPTIMWLFNGSPAFPPGILTLGAELLLRSPITGDMRGNYTCRVDWAGISATTVYVVQVDVGPNLVVSPQLLPEDPSFAGGRLEVTCEDRVGFPLSDVLWNQNGTRLTNPGGRVSVTSTRTAVSAVSTLAIDPVLPSDIGSYSCITQNAVATSERSFELVQVLEIESHVERLVWLVGEVLTLQVRVRWTSIHTPSRRLNWEWTKDGAPVSAGSRVISTSRRQEDIFTIELEVIEAIESDSGAYACRVSSSLGSKVLTFGPLNVYGFYVNSYSYPTDSGLFAGMNLHLTCVVTASPGLYQSHLNRVEAVWTRGGGEAVGSRDSHLTVSGTAMRDDTFPAAVYESNVTFSPLMEGDEGEYVCTVTCYLSNEYQVVTNHTRTLLFDSVLFQLSLLEVGSCQEWVNDNAQAKANRVISAIVSGVNQNCPSCDLTTNHITSAFFQCFPESPKSVTFRARIIGTSTVFSEELLGYVEAWLRDDGTVPIDAVLVSLDQSCPLAILSRTDPACFSGVTTTDDITVAASASPSGQSGVPLVLVVGVSAGVGLLLVLAMGVVIAVIIVTVMSRTRRTLAIDGKRDGSPYQSAVQVSAVNPIVPASSGSNPSLTCNGQVEQGLCEPQYEDIDKYDYIRSRGQEQAYEKMASVQIMPTKAPPQIMPTSSGFHSKPDLQYDYAAV